ncbi:MAG: hypothetical protein K2X82_16880, partial [Gemmataceae bacterium]|nr:hypothetical protein [Gemmataceae bacterium]
GVAPALAGLAAAAVPADLMARAVAAGVSPEAVPAAVAALSNGVARTMLVPKLKLLAAVAVLAAGALGYGLAAGPPKPAPAPAEAPKPAAKADPKPRPKGLDRILILKSGHLVLIDPDGKAEKQLTANLGDFRPGRARLSPDGAAYATVIRVGPADPPAGQLPRFKLYVRKLTDPEPGTDLGVEARGFCWSPDGTRLAVSEPGEAGGPGPQYNHSLVDVKTGKKTELKLPAGHMVTGWTAGDKLVTQSVDNAPGRPRSGVHLMNPDGTEAWASTGQPGPQFGSPSPDGKRLLTLQATGQARPPGGLGVPPAAVQTLVLTDVATGQAARVDGYPDRTVASQDYCWSPDGKRIAYVWHEAGADGAPTDSHLVVCDPDGKNPKTVLSVKCDGSWRNVLGAPDWR